MAENTVPATTATTDSRPGTRQMARSMASIAAHRDAGAEQDLAHQDEERDRRERELEIDATPLRIICT
jgi:hypothetical protein